MKKDMEMIFYQKLKLRNQFNFELGFVMDWNVSHVQVHKRTES
jgi:hypothetical protein